MAEACVAMIMMIFGVACLTGLVGGMVRCAAWPLHRGPKAVVALFLCAHMSWVHGVYAGPHVRRHVGRG